MFQWRFRCWRAVVLGAGPVCWGRWCCGCRGSSILPTRCARPGLDPASMRKNLFLVGENGKLGLASVPSRAASRWSAPDIATGIDSAYEDTTAGDVARLAERRILQSFVRYGRTAQFAPSVRGSSRRIMTMRFRPADIRVINRRIRLWSRHPLWRFANSAQTLALTRSPHIRSRTSPPAAECEDLDSW